MTDTPHETIAQRLNRKGLTDPNATARERNLAVIHTYRKEIESALAAGWSILATWRLMSADGRVTSTYQSFRKHINRYILDKPVPTRHR